MGIQILVDSSGDAVEAVEESTLAIVISFTDEDGNAETPATANWTLTDDDGDVINSREEVTISSLDTSVTVVLSGDDLALQSGESGSAVRRFVVQGTYNSDLGNGLPMIDSVAFPVRDVKYAV